MQNFASFRMFRARAQWITTFFMVGATNCTLYFIPADLCTVHEFCWQEDIFLVFNDVLSAVGCRSSISRQFPKISFLYLNLIDRFLLHKRKQKTSSDCRRLGKIIQNRFSPVCVRGFTLLLFLSFFLEGRIVSEGFLFIRCECENDFYLFTSMMMFKLLQPINTKSYPILYLALANISFFYNALRNFHEHKPDWISQTPVPTLIIIHYSSSINSFFLCLGREARFQFRQSLRLLACDQNPKSPPEIFIPRKISYSYIWRNHQRKKLISKNTWWISIFSPLGQRPKSIYPFDSFLSHVSDARHRQQAKNIQAENESISLGLYLVGAFKRVNWPQK